MRFKLKNITLGLLLSFVLLLLTTQSAHGFALDLASNQLEGISERSGPIATALFFALLFFAVGRLLLSISTSLLYSIMLSTPAALTVNYGGASEFVQKGWSFTVGIVNMVMILAFMVIAFAVILGSEKIQLKKALPKLIIVALLVNFTLVFVGAGIDISNFLYNSILTELKGISGGGNAISNAITPLFEFGATQIAITTGYLIANSASLLVPYLNVATQFAWIIGIKFLFNTFLKFFVYGGIMWFLSGLFLLYFVVFLIRIFIIQILAILAPIAFFCLIFEDTKKYWKQWLDNFLQWLFVGVIFIFLMYFGLSMAPTVTSMASGLAADDTWVGEMLGYFALLAYFIIIAGLAKKLAPAAVGMVINQVQGFAKMAMPLAAGLAIGTATNLRGTDAKRQEDIKKREEREKTGQVGFLGKARTRGMKAMSWSLRRAHNIAGTSVAEESKKDVDKKAEAIKKKYGDSEAGRKEFLETYIPGTERQNLASDTAALRYIQGGGADVLTKANPRLLGRLLEAADRKGDSKTVKDTIKHIPDYGDIKQIGEDLEAATDPKEKKKLQNKLNLARKIQTIMTPDAKKAMGEAFTKAEDELTEANKELATAISSGVASSIDAARDKVKEASEKVEKITSDGVYKISVQSLKAKDVETLSSSTLENKSFLKAVAENKNMSFVKMLEERKDAPKVVAGLDQELSNIGAQELEKANPTLYNQIKRTPAAQSLFSGFHQSIETHEQGKADTTRIATINESIRKKESQLSRATQDSLSINETIRSRGAREAETLRKEIDDLKRSL